MTTIDWSDPRSLSEHRRAPTGPGIYVIGDAFDPTKELQPCREHDPYLFNWPFNFRGLYVGISESLNEGIRRRLRSHYRGRGNKDIGARIRRGERLWFIASCGIEVVDLEAGLLLAVHRESMFMSNIRDEKRRYALRLKRRLETDMRARGLEPTEFPAFDPDDYF